MQNEAPQSESPSQDPRLKATVEAIVYVADEPVTLEQITRAIEGTSRAQVLQAILSLQEESRHDDRGLEIREIAGGYKMFTKPEHHETIRRFVRDLTPPLKLSLPALETLATIAYRQPITIPEIQQIRGVHAVAVIKTLLDRKLITTAGRKEVIGRPVLYKTTKEFLKQFGLSGLDELPSIEEFEELARAALGDALPQAPESNAAAAGRAAQSEDHTQAAPGPAPPSSHDSVPMDFDPSHGA